MALELDGGDQASLVHHQQIPQLGGPEIAGQGQHRTLLVDHGLGQPVSVHQVHHQIAEVIHVLSSRNARAFTLVGFAGQGLLAFRVFAVLPKRPDGLLSLAVVITQI